MRPVPTPYFGARRGLPSAFAHTGWQLDLSLILLLWIAMPTYEESDFELIAAAISVDVGQIVKHENLFEAAALWYRLDEKQPERTAASSLRRNLDQISKSAHRLLKSLAVNNPNDAADGPGDREILNALVLIGERHENPVIEATRRIGRLLEIIDGIAAAAEFERRAKNAATEVVKIGKLTVREGNPGDAAINNWIAAMMSLYRKVTGKEPATSVGAPGRTNVGIAGGPLIRFLEAAGEPLKIEFSEDAWRSRVRTILKGASVQN
jgi:hypothetical protein